MGMFDKKTEDKEPKMQQGYDMFSGIDNAKVMEKDPYIDPGVYPLLYCSCLKAFQSKRDGQSFFVAEFDILDSNVESRPAGTRMALVINYSKSPEVKLNNIKTFLMRLTDSEEDEVTSEAFKLCCSEKNPCRGRLIRLEAVNATTKNGAKFLQCSWATVPEEVQAKAESLRNEAGFSPF